MTQKKQSEALTSSTRIEKELITNGSLNHLNGLRQEESRVRGAEEEWRVEVIRRKEKKREDAKEKGIKTSLGLLKQK